MSESNLESALRDLLARERDQWPNRHPQETDECLPLSRLVPGRRDSWTPEQHAHIRGCRSYCQRMIAISWRQECPDILDLIAYASRSVEHECAAAFAFHLEKDQCRWCNAVVTSTLAATAPLHVAAGLLPLRTARAFGFATDPESERELATERGQTPDNRLAWTLYERPDHEILLEVETPDPADDGRQPKALLSGETEVGDVVTEEVALPPLGWNGHLCRDRHRLGMAADLARKFGKQMRVAVWLPEDKK